MTEKMCTGYFAVMAQVLIDGAYVNALAPTEYFAITRKQLAMIDSWMREGGVCGDCLVRFGRWDRPFIEDSLAAAESLGSRYPHHQQKSLQEAIDAVLDELAASDDCLDNCYTLLLR